GGGGRAPIQIERIILTASGGPFRLWPREKIAAARASDALRHPNWSMGAKITIDSATLMNKGLELIEAMRLFNQPPENIEILVHPQSIIHSMVRYIDGSVIAQLGPPDMRLPILYALSAPERVKNNFPRLDFATCGALTFEPPNTEKFPCLALALQAAKTGGTLPAVMNYVNEWAVEQFLKNKIGFYGISSLIDAAFHSYTVKSVNSLQDIIEAEAWAEEFTKNEL
ncbi:MAG: 1-deoxy-D-xylulose-5-phosphate reductoisomerase, partial [Defluviitaleaceae bacterium]|nr:1-deoxy-D-xylulose-5-phosphate reductoisomerase [Defluviitaleaceae bacterium]